jgi:hypothetical protein
MVTPVFVVVAKALAANILHLTIYALVSSVDTLLEVIGHLWIAFTHAAAKAFSIWRRVNPRANTPK